jgi:hypothetical protein
MSNAHAELANLDDTFLSGSKLSGTIEINTALLREDLHLVTFLKNQPVGAGLDVSSDTGIADFDNTADVLHGSAIGRVVTALGAVEQQSLQSLVAQLEQSSVNTTTLIGRDLSLQGTLKLLESPMLFLENRHHTNTGISSLGERSREGDQHTVAMTAKSSSFDMSHLPQELSALVVGSQLGTNTVLFFLRQLNVSLWIEESFLSVLIVRLHRSYEDSGGGFEERLTLLGSLKSRKLANIAYMIEDWRGKEAIANGRPESVLTCAASLKPT